MLVIALMSMMLMTALGTALVLTTLTETTIAANYNEGTEAFYAAEAAVEWTIQDLALAPDWTLVGTREPYVDARLADLLPGASSSRMHVIVRIARPLETDAEPDAGVEVLIVLGQASGTGGSSRAIEVAIAREEALDPGNPAQIRVLRWREVT